MQSVLSALALAPLISQVVASPCQMTAPNAKVVYTITNTAENAVVALPIQQDGTIGDLNSASSTVTGGKGGAGISGSTNASAGPDALFSQQPLTVAGNLLFAVNPGSNSLTMFTIDKNDPTKLSAACEPLDLPGEFPVTVAASEKDKLVCVGFSGAKAGVSCSKFSEYGMEAMDQLRPFELNQSTPPVGPTNTVSQVFFSEDGKTLFSTVKGDPTVNNTGFLAAYPVSGGAVSQQLTKSSPPGTAVLFGTNTIRGTNKLFVTDASFGGAVLDIDAAGQSTVAGLQKIPDQMATCWVSINQVSKTAFVTDVLRDVIVEMSLTDASIVNTLDLSANGDPGFIDLVSGGKFLYALSPGNETTPASVTVVDAVSKKQIQHQQVQSLGLDKNAAGMAMVH